jgi:error-prone DNA polymerase
MSYTELQVTTNFSFLRGGSHPEELVEQAADYGYDAIAITDRNTLAGIVRAHVAAKSKNIRILPACRLDLLDGPSLLAYPTDTDAYGRLSALLTTGNLRAEKGQCHLYTSDVYGHAKGLKFIVIPPSELSASFAFDAKFLDSLGAYREAFGDQLYLAASRSYRGDDGKQLYRLAEISKKFDISMVATNDVHYHNPDRRQLQDVLTCIREKCTIQTAGFRLDVNAERHLKHIHEMLRLFRQYPDSIHKTREIADACQFSLASLKYVYPLEITTGGRTPQEELTMLTWEGAHRHFGVTVPEKTIAAIHHELSFIAEMNYASYFLTVHDIVRFAREQNILCQGRGSAANSTVCYCLGITSVDPTKFDLLFERFLSSARNEPPDIDVDFEHERREEVIQYIYKKYGRDRAGIVATVTQERRKGAIRDVGKVMGLSVDTINHLSASLWQAPSEWFTGDHLASEGFNMKDRTLVKTLELTVQLMGFPRQLGQHTGGFVITEGQLSDLCPILNARMEDRTCIEWNKDDIDALGFLKIDVLALGMLTCIRKAFDLAKLHYGRDFTLANIPQDDPAVYEMISHADTIGVFQIESRAQMSMLPRLRPNCFYDLVIEVAIVRPGPIQGDMVHPYLRRRNGEEKVEYPSRELEEILGRTLGVPLFQEQAMKVAIVAGGFTPSEADELRRAMATFKAVGVVSRFQEKLISGMIRNGYTPEYAQRIFRQLEGFGSYGFPESHAASFALLVYVSSWLKCYYPDVFACALLNSMPMGFYQPAQIVSDARRHGVEVRPIDVNLSGWDNVLEDVVGGRCAIRLGFRQVKGLREEDMDVLVRGRGLVHGAAPGSRHVVGAAAGSGYEPRPYTSLPVLCEAGVTEAVLERLADADAFRSMGLDRRQALWAISALKDRPIALFVGQPAAGGMAGGAVGERAVEDDDGHQALPKMTDSEHVVHDYAATSLSLKAHPVSFVREKLSLLRITPNAELARCKDGDTVSVAGLVLVRQRPGTASGIVFITIEDETGCANLVTFSTVFDKYRKTILQSRLLIIEGKLQVEGEVIHVIAQHCTDGSKLLRQLTVVPEESLPKQKDIFADARNFK